MPEASTTSRAGALGGTRSGCCTRSSLVGGSVATDRGTRPRRRVDSGSSSVMEVVLAGRRGSRGLAAAGSIAAPARPRAGRSAVGSGSGSPRCRIPGRRRRLGVRLGLGRRFVLRGRVRPAGAPAAGAVTSPASGGARCRRPSTPSGRRYRRTTGTPRARTWPGRRRRRRSCRAVPRRRGRAAPSSPPPRTRRPPASPPPGGSGSGRRAHCWPTATAAAAATISNATHTGPSGGVGTAASTGSAGTSPPSTVNELKVASPTCALDPTATADAPTMTFGAYSTDSTVRLNWPNAESVMAYRSCIVAQCTTRDPAVTTPDRPTSASTPAVAARNASGSQSGSGEPCTVRRPTCDATPSAAPIACTASTAPKARQRVRGLQVGEHRRGVVDDRQRDRGDQQRATQRRGDDPADDEPGRALATSRRRWCASRRTPSAAPAAAASRPVRCRRSRPGPRARPATCWRWRRTCRSCRCWR